MASVDESDTGSPLTSRKFIMTLVAMGLIALMAVAGIWLTGAAEILTTFTTSILGALSLYLTGNLVSQHVASKTGNPAPKAQPTADASPGIGFTSPQK